MTTEKLFCTSEFANIIYLHQIQTTTACKITAACYIQFDFRVCFISARIKLKSLSSLIIILRASLGKMPVSV